MVGWYATATIEFRDRIPVWSGIPVLARWLNEGRKNNTIISMNNLVNIIIVLLIVGWLIGYIGFGAMVGSLIHILLILALIAIVFRLFSGRKGGL